jgi:hypothetical protein
VHRTAESRLFSGERHCMTTFVPLATIHFVDYRALVVFHGMAEGMEEVRRDDDDIEMADALTRLIEVTGTPMNETSVNVTIILPDDLVEPAMTVLENCLDVSSGR